MTRTERPLKYGPKQAERNQEYDPLKRVPLSDDNHVRAEPDVVLRGQIRTLLQYAFDHKLYPGDAEGRLSEMCRSRQEFRGAALQIEAGHEMTTLMLNLCEVRHYFNLACAQMPYHPRRAFRMYYEEQRRPYEIARVLRRSTQRIRAYIKEGERGMVELLRTHTNVCTCAEAS